jgi:hypothetical protein
MNVELENYDVRTIKNICKLLGKEVEILSETQAWSVINSALIAYKVNLESCQ